MHVVRAQIAPPDSAVAEIAGRQHGVVTFKQLLDAGVGRGAVRDRTARGQLHRIHRGVYAVGFGEIPQEARWMAAVLACGWRAVLSHRSAAIHWRLLSTRDGWADVSVRGRAGSMRRAGIRVHRPRSLHDADVTERLSIPVTTPARTLSDIQATCPAWEVRRATRQAEFLELPLGAIETDGSRSDLEDDFLALCSRHRIPAPEVNVKVGPWTVDFLWRSRRLVVETDFYGYHRGRTAFRDDRARDLDLRRRGFAVRRYSEEQVNEDTAAVVADLRDALGLAS
jgi:putative AbiEi antitoxin of type IV toxin-antitoxin system/uncharacterized protein DUF559